MVPARLAEPRASYDTEAPGTPATALVAAFQRLDFRLARAIEAIDAANADGSDPQPYRGLYLASADVRRGLDREPGAPRLGAGLGVEGSASAYLGPFEPTSRLAKIGRVFGLSPFDLGIVLIALAPEFDTKYERTYAYLQDDVSRRRPTVDLALDLLCRVAPEKLARRSHFAPDAPLVASRILHVWCDPNSNAPLPSWSIRLDEQVVRYLLQQRGLDPRLTHACRLLRTEGLPDLEAPVSSLSAALQRSLLASVIQAKKERRPLRLYFEGQRGAGQAAVAAALAAEAGSNLLLLDLSRWTAPAGPDGDLAIRVLMREAIFQGALLYIEPWDVPHGAEAAATALREAISGELAEFRGVAILCGERAWEPSPRGPRGVVAVRFEIPPFASRLACWKAQAAEARVDLEESDLEALATLYRLNADQIADAVGTASATLSVERSAGSAASFFHAARAQSGHALARLARRIEPAHSWGDLVLSDGAALQLHEVCQRIRHKKRVLEDWGFGRKIARSGGTSALFSGPSGTGKTTAASIVAADLHLNLYEIDLSRVVSKYIGETEQNLRKIFEAAVNSNAILLFNEADALWGKRSEVRDAHDRYANIEIAFLLQEMEQFEGIAILTTSLRQHIDDAFTRRLDFVIEFPFPDDAARRRLWEVLLPPEAPRRSIDLDLLAQLRLSGGNIKNVIYAAAFLAADEGSPIETRHLVRGVRREFQKLGRSINESEMGDFAESAAI